MKLKTSIFYQMRTLSVGAGVFFTALIAILAVLHLAISFTHPDSMVNIDKFDVNFIDVTVGFIILAGIVTTIRHNFKYFIQNGCSRLTIFSASLLTYLFFSFISATFVVLIHLPKLRVGTKPLFQMLYGQNSGKQLVWSTAFYFMLCALFYLLVNISAVLSPKQNRVVSAALAVLGLVLIPVLSLIFPDLHIVQRLFSGFQNFFGKSLSSFSAIKAIGNFVLVIVSVSVVNLLVVKRIQIFD